MAKPFMTRKHYDLLMDVFAKARAAGEHVDPLVERLADRLASTSPTFNRSRFIEGTHKALTKRENFNG